MHKQYYFDSHDNFNEAMKTFIKDDKIDFPLYHRHLGNAIRFNFEDFSAHDTYIMASKILAYIFNEREFFYCCYGDIGIPKKRLKRYLKGIPNKPHCIEYSSPNNDEDFQYEFDNISFVQVYQKTFNFNRFAKDISYGKGRENEQFLISIKEKIAVHFYDCRGIDIVSLGDNSFLESLQSHFHQYPHWCEKTKKN